jgi:two-component system, LytTR family, response regulator
LFFIVDAGLRLTMLLKTVIVEDELHSREFLLNLLSEFCPDVQPVAIAASKDEAIEVLSTHKPDLVFLDIELRRGTGFDVLKSLGCPDFHVVFTTASDHHSIKAIQFSGADYLLKPIDIELLQQTINAAREKINNVACKTALKHLYTTLQNGGMPEHLFIQNSAGNEYAVVCDIIRIEGRDNGVEFFLRSGSTLLSSLSLRDYEILLEDLPFFRAHSSHIINLREIAGVLQYPKDIIEMSDGSLVALSPKRKDDLKEMQKQLASRIA